MDIPDLVSDEVLIAVSLAEPQQTDVDLGTDFQLSLISSEPIALLNERVVRYRIPDARTVAAVINELSQDTRITAAQPNYIYRKLGDGQPDSAEASGEQILQYALAKLGADDAHMLAQGVQARVAVIDSGIDATHQDLKGAVANELDTAAADTRADAGTNFADPHGTAVAGIIAARGLAKGIAPSSELLSVRAFSSGIVGDNVLATTMRILIGLDWALRENAKVVNMSFVGPRDNFFERGIAKASAAGAILVAAAGNNGPEAPPAYPAAYDDVIAVTATDANDALYEKANRGTYVAIAAPGVDLFVPSIANSYDIQSGTSFAAAYISGVVALLVELEPKVTFARARETLRAAATDLGPPGDDPMFGSGRINAASALHYSVQQRDRKHGDVENR